MEEHITILSTLLSQAPPFFWWGLLAVLLVVLLVVLGIPALRLQKAVILKVIVLFFGRASTTKPEPEATTDEPNESGQAA